MDELVGFFIPNVLYFWKDRHPTWKGLRGWDEGRFSRSYWMVPGSDVALHRGADGLAYLVEPSKCPKISTYFRASTGKTHANLEELRLNGKRLGVAFPLNGPRDESLVDLRKYKLAGSGRGFPAVSLAQLHNDLRPKFPSLKLELSLKDIREAVKTDPNARQIWPFRVDHEAKNIPQQTKSRRKRFPLTERHVADLFLGREDLGVPGLDLGALQMTNQGVYAITNTFEARQIVHAIQSVTQIDPRALSITDATAGVGGDTIRFANVFGQVNAVELNPLHCSVLARNLSVFGIQNRVNLVCGDYLAVVGFFKGKNPNYLKQHVVFLDPPWGGVGYRKRDKVFLSLDGIPVGTIVRHILKTGQADFVFVKIPNNADLTSFPDVSGSIGIYKRGERRQPSFQLIWFDSATAARRRTIPLLKLDAPLPPGPYFIRRAKKIADAKAKEAETKGWHPALFPKGRPDYRWGQLHSVYDPKLKEPLW